jgi:hypothetical protein
MRPRGIMQYQSFAKGGGFSRDTSFKDPLQEQEQ